MTTSYKAIKGMNDILPTESHKWLWLEDIIKNWAMSYGYQNIRTPVLEDTKLFVRAVGEVTDIVEKEMYTFVDTLNNDNLTLRPEGTAGVTRAVIEHDLLYNNAPKLWYIGQMFRHERPQKGRYRQFYQLGIEAFGYKEPTIDAEIISMQYDLWHRLGIHEHLTCEINCLGNMDERASHKVALIKYFEAHVDSLDDNAKNKMYKNPLRVLDTKNPDLKEIMNHAPKLIDYLKDDSLGHYNKWKEYLNHLNIPFVENHRLVRGLDYYNLSVFEWVTDKLGAQSTVCAGGRYDSLIGQLGGKSHSKSNIDSNYAIGFACGLERLLLLLNELDKFPSNINKPLDVYIAHSGADSELYSMKIANLLRQNKYSVVENLHDISLKAQLKKSSNLNSKITIIIGETEMISNSVMVKFMDTGEQNLITITNLIECLKRKI